MGSFGPFSPWSSRGTLKDRFGGASGKGHGAAEQATLPHCMLEVAVSRNWGSLLWVSL